LLIAFSITGIIVVISCTTRSGLLARERGIPGSFKVLGDLGGSGQYCYERNLFSERFAARIERFSSDNFRDFLQKYDADTVETSAASGSVFLEKFLEEFGEDCRIDPGDLKWGVLGSGSFGKHGLLQFFYSEKENVMILVGTKAF